MTGLSAMLSTSSSSSSSAWMCKTAVIVFLFMLIGPSLIIINQYILKTLGFPYPMFLSGLGVLFTGLAARLVVALGMDKIQNDESIQGINWYKTVLPIGVASAITLTFGNMTYLYLDVGFIQMLKAFSPAMIVFTSYMTGVEYASNPVIVSVFVISLGVATTCSFAPSLNLIGLLVMFIAEFSESFRLVLTQYFLQQLKFGVLDSAYHIAPASAFWLFLASGLFEVPRMMEHQDYKILFEHPRYFLLSGCMGVGVNFISYFMIQCTSSLTMKILVQVRNICMVILGVLFYSEVITTNQGIGYFIALCGFAGYNMSKMGMFDQYVRSTAIDSPSSKGMQMTSRV